MIAAAQIVGQSGASVFLNINGAAQVE